MIISELLIQHIKGTNNKFKLDKGFRYIGDDINIEVHPDWVTDGASVPQIFWNIFPPIAGRYLEAAVLHDALYKKQCLPRKKCDLIFLKAMKDCGVKLWKCYIIYFAVRLFGFIAWYENKRKGLNDTCTIKTLGG